MRELILQLVTERPTEVYEFIHDWVGKKLNNEMIPKPKVTEDIRKSMPNLVYPEDKSKNCSKAYQIFESYNKSIHKK